MSTYTKLVTHFIFSTRRRTPWLTEDIRPDVFRYMGGIIRNQRCLPFIVNGVNDHVHVLAHVHPNIPVSTLMREVKSASSEYVHREKRIATFAWQEGYAAFSVRGSDHADVYRYIEDQAAHHGQERFESELRRHLVTAGIEYQEKYLLG
jgi:REP element-mobilizing transposase RayT